MLPSLPLYESLVTNTTDKPILMKNKKKLIELISSMDETGKELVFVLVKYHSMKNEEEQTNIYKCQVDTSNELSDLRWDLTDIPNKLQQILFKFAEKEHRNRMEIKTRGVGL
jgi:hypothetical protein